MKKKYYIRIGYDLTDEFERYLISNAFLHERLTFAEMISSENKSSLFSTLLDDEEAMLLKLKFPCVGFLDFAKTLGRQIKHA